MIICPQCKNKIPENWTVCQICNAKLPKIKKKDNEKRKDQTREASGKIKKILATISVALVVAIFVIVYAWASGFTSEMTSAEVAEAEQLVLENQEYKDGIVEVCIRNPLNNPAVIYAEYRNGSIVAEEINQILDGNDVACFNLQYTGYNVGDDCWLVTEEGTQIMFKIKA